MSNTTGIELECYVSLGAPQSGAKPPTAREIREFKFCVVLREKHKNRRYPNKTAEMTRR